MTSFDHTVQIGHTHKVCQDYALSGITKSGIPFAIVSDGCSSSPHTDIGARILAHCAKKCLEDTGEINPDTTIARADVIRSAMDLPVTALDATLLAVHEMDGAFHYSVYGDGVIAELTPNRGIVQHIYVSPQNAPHYLSYRLDPKREQVYLNMTGGRPTERLVVTEGMVSRVSLPFTNQTSYTNEGLAVVLFSDGVESFQAQTEHGLEDVPVEDVLNQMMDFKNFQGEFITRRWNKFHKTCLANRWSHYDDFSAAGLSPKG